MFKLLRLLLLFMATGYLSSIYAIVYNGSCGTGVKWELDTSTGIMRIYGNGKMNDYYVQDIPYKKYSSYIRTLKIEEGVTYVGENAFYNMPIYYIYFPSTIKKIGMRAFHGRDNMVLQEVHYPNLETLLNLDMTKSADYPCHQSDTNPLVYGPRLFIGDDTPYTIRIPDTYTEIKNYTFSSIIYDNGLFQVTSISIPASIVKMGANSVICIDTIRYEGSLVEWCNIKRGNTLASQYDCAYDGVCSCDVLYINNEKVVNLTIPNGVNTIGRNMFSGCRSIRTITFPQHVNMIDYYAFCGCNQLKTIYVENPIPPSLYSGSGTDDYIFCFSDPKDIDVYIPQGTMNLYQKTEWAKYNLIEQGKSEVEEIKISEISINGNILSYNAPINDLYIYSIEGVLIAHLTTPTDMEMEHGIYVLKQGEHRMKILIP